LLKDSNQTHFSNDVDISTKEEKVENKLTKLRKEMFEEDETIDTGFFYDKRDKLLNSKLYECLMYMPKPAVHHIHLTAACPIEFLVKKLCSYDFVYFSEKDQKFKVTKQGRNALGEYPPQIKENNSVYVKVNLLRQYWSDAISFDEHLT